MTDELSLTERLELRGGEGMSEAIIDNRDTCFMPACGLDGKLCPDCADGTKTKDRKLPAAKLQIYEYSDSNTVRLETENAELKAEIGRDRGEGMKANELDEYITTNLETSAAIMKAINEILWQEKMQILMKELALELQRMGVDFSTVWLEIKEKK
jgi:hypothetical protein